MAQARVDITGDTSELQAKIALAKMAIRELERSAADVYAMRGDAGMVGLQRQIAAANVEIAALRSQLRSLNSDSDVQGIINQFQGLGRAVNSARESASVFRAAPLGSQGFIDDAQRIDGTLRQVQADKKRWYDQETADMSSQAARQKKALQDQLANLKAYYKEQDSLQKDQRQFAQQIAPRSEISDSEIKHQYDAQTASLERQATAQRNLAAATKMTAAEYLGQMKAQEYARQTAPKSLDELGPIGAKTTVKYDPSIQKYVQDFRKVGEASEEGFGKAGFALRHVIALFDEYNRGQHGAMIASASAMARDLGAVELLMNNLTNPWTAVAAAGIAAAVAIGVAFEQMIQRTTSVSRTMAAQAFQGGHTGSDEFAKLDAQFRANMAATHEWAGTLKDLNAEIDKLPIEAQAARQQLTQIATALAQATGETPAKAAEGLIHAFGQTAEETAKLVEKQFNLKGILDANGRSLSQQVAQVADLREKYILIGNAILNTRGATIQAENAARSSSQSWAEWAGRIGGWIAAAEGMPEAGVAASEAVEKINNPLRKGPDLADKFSDAIRRFNTAVSSANDGLTAGVTLLHQYEAAMNAASSAAQQMAVANLKAQLDKMAPQAGEEDRHQRAMDNIQAEMTAKSKSVTEQYRLEKEKLQEIIQTQTNKRIAIGVDPEKARSEAIDTTEVIKQEQVVAEAKRRIGDENVQVSIDQQRAIIQNEMVGTQARIAAQQQVIKLVQGEVAAGRASKTELAQEEIKLQTLIRQERMKTFQEARDNAQAEVELAKGNVSQIIAAYDKLRAAARTAGMPPAAFAQIDREQVRALETAQQKAFSQMTEYNSAQERLGNLQIAAEKARLNEQVAAHKMSKEAMEQAESDFSQKVMAADEARVQQEIQNDNLTAEQKEKLFEHLAELYEKDAELQIQAQEKITQAIEAENKKREAIFTKTFDEIGSEGEKAIEGLFDRSKTHGQVLATAARDIFKDVAKSLGTELSEVAGQKIGPSLGLKPEESKGGLGQVLGDALFKALGLEKEAKTDPQKQTAEKMQKAVEAQTEAAKLQKEAGQQLKEAAQALKGMSGQKGVPSQYDGQGGQNVNIGPAPPQAQAAVQYALDQSGEKLKSYCATLVNQALEKAGVQGSGSGLASSFGPGSSFGTPIDPSQVRAGDVFYKEAPGFTGHVGLTTGPVSDGRVPVVSSHISGSMDNPAGAETRSIEGMTFRRPNYDESGQGASVGMVKLDPSSSQVVSSGVVQGQQESASVEQTSVEEGVSSGNTQVVQSQGQNKQALDQNKQSIDKNTTSVDKNSTALQNASTPAGTPGGGISSKDASSTSSGFSLFTQGLGMAASAAALFGPRMSTVARVALGAVGAISQLSSFMKNLNSSFDLFGTTTKAVTTATGLEQSAKTLNATATATDTTAMQTNAAAASASGGGGLLGGLFKLFAFEGGGVVPSAAGGMVVGGPSGGTLSLLHPQEMVLPAGISRGLQGMINSGGGAGGGAGTVLNYNANVTGYHPFNSRSEFESMLRSNSGSMMDFVRNEVMNRSYR